MGLIFKLVFIYMFMCVVAGVLFTSFAAAVAGGGHPVPTLIIAGLLFYIAALRRQYAR